ncbi:hypothetical protein JOQ06_025853, partial [Pogonophryne albipinna]
WHVKECNVPPVPTLPVADALCQAPPPSLPCPAQAVGTTSPEYARDCGWCQAAEMSRSTHTLTGSEEAQWLQGSAKSPGNHSCSPGTALGILSPS